jgi:hypothetical protein
MNNIISYELSPLNPLKGRIAWNLSWKKLVAITPFRGQGVN